MSEYVLDASALLAVMLGERGADAILEIMQNGVIGAVNLAEVATKLQERGVLDNEIDREIGELDLPVIAFDERHAIAAGKLRVATRAAGLSLGDRACLALAMARGLPAVTMDRSWLALDIGAEIIVARD